MSWIVGQLIRDSLKIHAEGDLESDDYFNLLLIEKKVKELYDKGLISDKELNVLKGMATCSTIAEVGRAFKMDEDIVSKIFIEVTNRIAYYLGDFFTDCGYSDYMAEKYNLNDEQVERLINYMESKFKNRIMKKPYKEN